MATIFTHPAIALGLFPWFKSIRQSKYILFTGMALTVAPDLDVIGLRLGIPYHHELGHRGLTHSIFFATIFCALLVWFFNSRRKISKFPVWVYFTLSMASHGVLDAMTNGGGGVAFLAPFDNERYFLPFRPIEVSTLNITYFFQGGGIGPLKSELLYIWPPALMLFAIGYFFYWRKSVRTNNIPPDHK